MFDCYLCSVNVAQLVKPSKGAVMPVKKRKLPDADDHEQNCKITR